MLMLPPGSRGYLATWCVDGRKGIDGLSALVRSQFGQDPLSGALRVLLQVPIACVLYWDRDGYVLTVASVDAGVHRVLSGRSIRLASLLGRDAPPYDFRN
jgi:hypothetical protein